MWLQQRGLRSETCQAGGANLCRLLHHMGWEVTGRLEEVGYSQPSSQTTSAASEKV